MLTERASKVFCLIHFLMVRSKRSRRIDTGIERRQQRKQHQSSNINQTISILRRASLMVRNSSAFFLPRASIRLYQPQGERCCLYSDAFILKKSGSQHPPLNIIGGLIMTTASKIFLFLLFNAATLGVSAAEFTVGGITVSRGEQVSGFIMVPKGMDEGSTIPITVAHGASDGPVLALIAGIHGYEYPPITALQAVRAQIDPTALSGTIIMVHIANMPSFLGRTIYYSPVDGKNLNRMYPGDPKGSISQRIAHLLTTEVIDQADYLIDLHGGDGNEALRPYVYMP
jgi:hypothetical protein